MEAEHTTEVVWCGTQYQKVKVQVPVLAKSPAQTSTLFPISLWGLLWLHVCSLVYCFIAVIQSC